MENVVKNEEQLGLRVKGEWWLKIGNNLTRDDVLNHPDREAHNVIVNVCSNLIASWSCMGNTMGGSLPSVNNWGIRTLAVGTGSPAWMNPPPETDVPGAGFIPADLVNPYRLAAEVARKQFANVTYVGSGPGYVPQTNRSNIVDFTTTFLDAEAVAPLVEMGLFGGSYHYDDGTGSDSTFANGGSMVNYKTFAVINKPATAEMTIIWRLTF